MKLVSFSVDGKTRAGILEGEEIVDLGTSMKEVIAAGAMKRGVRYPKNLGPADFLYDWEFHKPPPAKSSYAVLYIEQSLLFYGIHMAGPNLNPQTFKQGAFNLPPVGGAFSNAVLGPGYSYGKNGGWPFEDYVAFDDTSEIWWKPDQAGKDELGNDGNGMYMFADGGKRYFYNQFPEGEPKMFDMNGVAPFYEDYPTPQERPPDYPCTGCPSAGGR